jgi:hypothetical protein
MWKVYVKNGVLGVTSSYRLYRGKQAKPRGKREGTIMVYRKRLDSKPAGDE